MLNDKASTFDEKSKETKILICGFGNIGKHIYSELSSLNVKVYDRFKIADPDYGSIDVTNIKDEYSIAFICVPTDMKEDGSVDISNVEDCVNRVKSDIIVIKSTIPIGFSNYLCNKYNKNIIYSPEFYGTTIHAINNPDFLILAGDIKLCDKVADLYHKVKPANFKIRFTDFKTAELVKYMENSFLGLKVTFCAEFYDIATRIGVSYNQLRELFVMDRRMGDSHTYIDPEKPYYDSHCLNKDIPGLIEFCNTCNIDVPLLKMMNQINKDKKEK